MKTKVPPDVVEAVRAKSSTDDVDDSGADIVDNGEDNDDDDTDEQRDVNQSLTLSMLMDEKSERIDTDTVDGDQAEASGENIDSNANANNAIKDAASNPSEIEKWIETVKQQNRERPSSTVYYEENMPDLQDLATRVWSEEFAEAAFKDGTMIDPDLDLTLEEYALVLCALLDVPLYGGNIIQSLHMVMSLFLEVESAEQVRILLLRCNV